MWTWMKVAVTKQLWMKQKPVILQVKISWSPSEQAALDGAMEQWSPNVFASPIASDLNMPSQFEALAKHVTEEEMRKHVRISSDLDQQIDWLRQALELGVSELYLHNVNREQSAFIEAFGRTVIPAVRQ